MGKIREFYNNMSGKIQGMFSLFHYIKNHRIQVIKISTFFYENHFNFVYMWKFAIFWKWSINILSCWNYQGKYRKFVSPNWVGNLQWWLDIGRTLTLKILWRTFTSRASLDFLQEVECSLKQFKEILSTFKEMKFPLAWLGVGMAYCRWNRCEASHSQNHRGKVPRKSNENCQKC